MATWIGSPNFAPGRQGIKIDRIVLHWIVGTLSAADGTFQNRVNNVSAHFGVGDTAVHQYVQVSDTAYHAGNWAMNLRSIGIEHQGGPNLPISNETYMTSARLIVDLTREYSIPMDKEHILLHKEIVATNCPGTLDRDRLISEAKRLIGTPGDSAPAISDQTRISLGGELGTLEVGAIRSVILDLRRDKRNLELALNVLRDRRSTPIITDQTKIDLGSELGIIEVGAIRSILRDSRRYNQSLSQQILNAQAKIGQLKEQIKSLS